MKYKQYQKMKDSGVEWIGEIPENWEVMRLKFACKINPPKSEIQNVSDEELVSFLPMELVSEEGTLQLDQNKRKDEVYDGFTYFRNGDVIVAKITPCFENGKGAFCENLKNGIGFGSTEFHVLRVLGGFDPKFIYHLTRSFPFKKMGQAMMYGAAGQKRVPSDFIENFVFPYPKNEDVKAISKFIEKQTNDFNDLISKSQSQIKLLQEKRQALISHAVTKGLDPTIPMKDSGVEWIGEIPEHWEVKRLKFVCQLNYGDSLQKENRVDGDIDVYGSNGIVGTHNIAITNSSTIIIGRKGSIGEINFSDNSCYPIDTTYYIDNLTTSENLRWIYYLLQTLELNRLNQDSAVPGLSRETVYQIKLPIPKKEERTQISEFLDVQTKQFDNLISKSKQQINFLQEKRQALITSAVTGKIDVRN